MSDSIVFTEGRPLIMGHRGDPGVAPENTIQSMKSAVEAGVDFLETDVRITKDDRLVLFHDDGLQRTTGTEGIVREKTLDELLNLDIGYGLSPDQGESFPFRGKEYKITLLGDALETFADTGFNLDMKSEEKHVPQLLADLIKTHQREDSVIVGSFHDQQIHTFRRLMPETATAACPAEVTKFVFALKMRVIGLFSKRCKYEAFQIPRKYGRINIVDERFIKASHERNIAIHVWTINERDEMLELIELGVDGIFTDDPSLLRSVLKEQGLL